MNEWMLLPLSQMADSAVFLLFFACVSLCVAHVNFGV